MRFFGKLKSMRCQSFYIDFGTISVTKNLNKVKARNKACLQLTTLIKSGLNSFVDIMIN